MKTFAVLRYTACLLLIWGNKVFSQPPHIIFMFIDDLGWNDVSFHGSLQIPTPNIDTLAYSGVILNNYYVQPICTPSRGALMTGKYPIKLGLQHYVISAPEPWGLSPKEVILPQHLKELGYAAHGVGKWHLGYFKNDYLPTNRGFDTFFGYWNGKLDYFTHFQQDSDHSGLDFHDDTENAWNYTGYYGTEVFTARAKKIIKDHDSSKPLFLYIAHQAVHAGNGYSPLQAPREYIEKFPHIKNEERRIYAAMTSALDKSVGEVFSALDEENMLDNSIIIFSTDNGGSVEGLDKSAGSNWPLRGSKYTLWEGGVRGSAFIWSPLLTRSYVSKDLMHVSDWLPTLYAAAGGNPKNLGEIDGYNLWPTLTQSIKSPRDHILHNIDPDWKMEAVLKGKYKLISGTVFDGNYDGWFDKEGKKEGNLTLEEEEELDVQREVYKKEVDNSEVFQKMITKYKKDPRFHLKHRNDVSEKEYCNSKKDKSENAKFMHRYNAERAYMHDFASPVLVECGARPRNASTNCQPTKDYCLFDIEKDPCEFNNLAFDLPSIVQDLKELLNKYRIQAVPIRNKPEDPNANPKYHRYAWIPWAEKESQNLY